MEYDLNNMCEVSESVQRDKIDLNLSCATGITAFLLMLLLLLISVLAKIPRSGYSNIYPASFQVGDIQPHNNYKITAINNQTTTITTITKIIATTIIIITVSKNNKTKYNLYRELPKSSDLINSPIDIDIEPHQLITTFIRYQTATSSIP